jgi:hypothetical protein
MVMGHPKLRRTRRRLPEGQVMDGYQMKWIWWSEHFRGGTKEQKAARTGKPVIAPRRGEFKIGNVASELVVPGLQAPEEVVRKPPVAPLAKNKIA